MGFPDVVSVISDNSPVITSPKLSPNAPLISLASNEKEVNVKSVKKKSLYTLEPIFSRDEDTYISTKITWKSLKFFGTIGYINKQCL